MQEDFDENYAIILQDEIQSAHWNHNQVTIFTYVCTYRQKEISLVHGKHTATTFLKHTIKDMKDFPLTYH